MSEQFRGSAADWDQRYSANPAGYGTEPNAFVRQVAEGIPDGPVLCLAEGQGRNAVYLARLGHEVLAVDQSAVGLRRARELADERGVRVQTQVADLADFAIAPGGWSGIVATFLHLPSELRRRVLAAAVQGLRPGGLFILEAFAVGQLGRSSGGPRSADLLLSVDLLRDELVGLELLQLRELERVLDEGPLHQGPCLVVQALGRKPGPRGPGRRLPDLGATRV
jgi:SAM-dependent methyltransferase